MIISSANLVMDKYKPQELVKEHHYVQYTNIIIFIKKVIGCLGFR